MAPPPDLTVLLAQRWFPGMTQPEADVARAWLAKHGHEYDAIEFNVRLGEGADPGDTVSDATRRHARLVTQKRADIVARVGGAVEIIEVKFRAGLSSLGQELGYRELWRRTYPGDSNVRLKVIAARIDADTRFVLERQGVAVELFLNDGAHA